MGEPQEYKKGNIHHELFFDLGFSAHKKLTGKLLRDQLNKYKSWYKEETQSKLDRSPNFKRETELLAKIELLKDLQKKLCQK